MAASEAASRQRTLDGPIDHPKTRKSYTREYKLEMVRFYREHNLYQTAKRFSLNTKTVGRWVSNEEKIKKSKRCQFPDVEEELYREYIQEIAHVREGVVVVYRRISLLGA